MIEVKNLTKWYRPKKGAAVQALKGINLSFEETGLVFILGKSGSGKSTLLNMLGGLDSFDEGEIIVKGKSSNEFAGADFDSYRNTFIGFIFQEYNILNDFTVGANIALAMELQGKKPTKETLNEILEEVDLAGYANRKPNELSGGQKQRVAIARALIKNPEIIMADEPTGALDSNTGKQVFDTLKRLSKDKLVIVVSHDREFAEQYGDRVIEMKDGEVISDIKKYTAKSANINEGVQIINDKIIHIKSGYELTSDDLEMINEYLRKNKDNESFISLDHRTNDKIKQAAQIDDEGNQQAFEDTSEANLHLQQYDSSKLKLIKSKLPQRSSLKMAAGSLKKKPFRLIMTVLLSMVSFSLFGLANTMSSYDKIQAGVDSIVDSKVDYIALTKESFINQGNWSYYVSEKFNEEDIANIQAKFPNQVLTKVTNVNNNIIDFGGNIADFSKLNPYGDFAYYPSSFAGAAVLTQEVIDNMGYTLVGSLPVDEFDIVITKATAESFVQGGYLGSGKGARVQKIASADKLIGKTLSFSMNSDQVYTITGILDTKFDGSRYEMFTKEQDPNASGMSTFMLQSEFREVLTRSYHNLLYTTESQMALIQATNAGVTTFGSTYDIALRDGEFQFKISAVGEISKFGADNVIYFDKAKQGLEEGEVILPYSVLEQNMRLYGILASAETVEEWNDLLLANKDIIESMNLHIDVATMDDFWEEDVNYVKVVGIYNDMQSMSGETIIVADGFLAKYSIDDSGRYTTVLSKMPTDRRDIIDVVNYSYDNGIAKTRYSLRNNTSNFITSVNGLVETSRNIFIGIGIGFAVFAGLMLMNFIATSINYRKREIGILRAVGARGRDVFVLFFEESIMIALINWVLSVIATGFVVAALNNMFRKQYNFIVTIFHFGILQIVLMLLLSLVVAFVASFLPVYNVSKKKPIEVIRKN